MATATLPPQAAGGASATAVKTAEGLNGLPASYSHAERLSDGTTVYVTPREDAQGDVIWMAVNPGAATLEVSAFDVQPSAIINLLESMRKNER
jgi:hypothetical protein